MNQESNFESRRSHARNFGGGVYIGGVLAATALFISFVLTAFPPDAYLSRVIMSIAGLAVGCSMLAFPYALHNWVVEKTHRNITTVLYYLEMVFIGVNTIVSFVTLLAKVTGYAAPEWAVLYEPFSVVSIIYVIFAWGTIFNFDPQSVTEHKQREYEETRKKLIAETKLEYLKAPEGRADIAAAAQEEIIAESNSRQPRSFFGNNQPPALADHLFHKKELVMPTNEVKSRNDAMLPCGHDQGMHWDGAAWACRICGTQYDLNGIGGHLIPIQDPTYHPVPMTPTVKDEPKSARHPFRPE